MERVVFRADASASMGSGHLMRCLTLAEELAARGARVSFLSRQGEDALLAPVTAAGHRLIALEETGDWQADADASRDALDGEPPADWLVVDHYGLDRRWENRLRDRARSLLALDDLADRPHDADMVVDPGPGPGRYAGLVPGGCRVLSGPRYALLRRAFRRHHRPDPPSGPAERARVHLFFGGVDRDRHTETWARLLLERFPGLRVRAVVGSTYPGHRGLQALAERHGPRLSWAAGVTDMAADMAACDLAVGAPGTAAWERACIGLPAAYLATAANQIPVLRRLAAMGLCVYLGEARDGAAVLTRLARFLADGGALAAMGRTAAARVDGLGAPRVAMAMEGHHDV